MRIVGGTFRGRRIVAPKGFDTRPTTDRVREAVFSSLIARGGPLADAAVADVFCGSGAMGLEALSRGATSATFIDCSAEALAALRRNVAALDVERRATICRCDAFTAVGRRLAGGPFALLFVDPPYRIVPARVSQLLEDWGAAELLAAGATVVYEHGAREAPLWPPGFELTGSATYGNTTVSYAVWRKESAK